MTQEEITNYNKLCAEFLDAIYSEHAEAWGFGNAKNIGSKMFHGIMYKNVIQAERFEKELKFHSDWNWIMEVADEIFAQGFRKYSYTHEEHSRCVFTDMAISYQKHEFGGGNIVADSGKCTTEKEAVVQAINQFLIWYNKQEKLNLI